MATATTTTSSPSMRNNSTSPLVVDRCLCGNVLRRPHQPPFDATSSLPPTTSNHDDDDNEENFSIYCSIMCARQDALDSLNAKEKDLRHSASSSTSFASSSSSSVPMSASMSTSTWNSTSTSTSASQSSFASSATSFSGQQLGRFSSSPLGLDSGQGEDNDQDDGDEDYSLWEFVTPATISPIPTIIPTATSPHLEHPCISFKSHYQRVVERENALKEENNVSSTCPPFLSFCQPPSSPATNVAPIPTLVEDEPPAQKRVINASPLDGTTDDEEERARTPRSWGVDNNSSTVGLSTPLAPSPPPSTTTTASISTLTVSSTSTCTSESDSESLSPPRVEQPGSQTRRISDIMRNLVDREPGVLEYYQSQWAFPPWDCDVVNYPKDDQCDEDSVSDTESDEEQVPQREFSELERPLPPLPPSPIQQKLHHFGQHPADLDAHIDQAELGPSLSLPLPSHLPRPQFEPEQHPTPTLTSEPTRLYSPRQVLEALALPPPFAPPCSSCKGKGKTSAFLAPLNTRAANHAHHSSCPNGGRLPSGGSSPGVRGTGRRLRLRLSVTSLFSKLLPVSKVRSRCASTNSVAVGGGLSLKSSPLLLSSSGSGSTSTVENKASLARPIHQSLIAATSRSSSYSPFPSTRELKPEEPAHGGQEELYDLRTPPMTATSSSSSFMISASTPYSTSILYSPPFPMTPRHRSIQDRMPIVARNPGYGVISTCPSGATPLVGQRKSSLQNSPFLSMASPTSSAITTTTTATAVRGVPFPVPPNPRRRRPRNRRTDLDMDQSDEDDVRDPFRYDSMLFASAPQPRSPTRSSPAMPTGQSAPFSSPSPLSKGEDDNADEEEANAEDEEEDERRAWHVLEAMRAAEFTHCVAAIGAYDV